MWIFKCLGSDLQENPNSNTVVGQKVPVLFGFQHFYGLQNIEEDKRTHYNHFTYILGNHIYVNMCIPPGIRNV
jgi:hypothetical protein